MGWTNSLINTDELSQFPVWSHVQDICSELKTSPSRFLVLTAETGAGKSTILPLGLFSAFQKKIVITQPRRLAVLGNASRVASLLKEDCGKTCGYKVHLDKKVSTETKIEFLTEAIMVKQLQEDPSLDDISVVIIDEFHERSIHTDLILAFLKETMEIRDDLYVIIMSATMNTNELQGFLNCPVMEIPGRMYPVQIEYKPETSMENAILSNINSGQTILAFIPSLKEINKTYEILNTEFSHRTDIQLCKLHSSISLDEQREVLKPAQNNICRVILSSAIAETSLTVPGVTLVIDSGLSRINKIHLATGMETLVTQKETMFSAQQRCGRAGRMQSGRCIRLWNKEDKLAEQLNPEILRCDLAPVILECAERGISSLDQIQWLNSPSKSAWDSATKFLKQINCLNDQNKITVFGQQVLKLPLEIRLACVAIKAFDFKTKHFSESTKQLILKYSSYKDSSSALKEKFIQDLEKRLSQSQTKEIFNSEDNIPLILYGYTDRLGKKCQQYENQQIEYQFPSGRKAVLQNSNGNPPEWIVCPQMLAGDSKGIIFEYEPVSQASIKDWLEKHTETYNNSYFKDGKIQKFQEERFGQIVLKSVKQNATQEDYSQAWINEIKNKGLSCLPLNEKINNLLLRAQAVQKNDVESELKENPEEWLLPFIGGKTNLDSETVYNSLYWYLNGSEIDKQAPNQIILENGNKCKVIYEKQTTADGNIIIKPQIQIIIQRIFGCRKIEKICGETVLLKLLSPASRPLQITEDLEGFWDGAWPEICKEMKGRYPKHNWDYRIPQKDD